MVFAVKICSVASHRAREVAGRAGSAFAAPEEVQAYDKHCSTFDSTAEGSTNTITGALADAVGPRRAILMPAMPVNGVHLPVEASLRPGAAAALGEPVAQPSAEPDARLSAQRGAAPSGPGFTPSGADATGHGMPGSKSFSSHPGRGAGGRMPVAKRNPASRRSPPMAGRKLVPSPTKVGTVINATHWSLPLLTAEARRLSTHPEVWDGVKEQAVKLQKSTTNEPDGVPTTADPREHVDYLSAPAEDAERHAPRGLSETARQPRARSPAAVGTRCGSAGPQEADEARRGAALGDLRGLQPGAGRGRRCSRLVRSR